MGIRGNEKADTAAKAALSPSVIPMKLPASKFFPCVNTLISEEWQKIWDNCTGNKLRCIRHIYAIHLFAVTTEWSLADYALVTLASHTLMYIDNVNLLMMRTETTHSLSVCVWVVFCMSVCLYVGYLSVCLPCASVYVCGWSGTVCVCVCVCWYSC